MKRILLLMCLLISAVTVAAQQKTHTYEKSIPASDIKQGTVVLEVPAGTLHLKATETDFMRARISYEHSDWKPTMSLAKNKGAANVTLKQENFKSTKEGAENKWEVSLSKSAPINLHLKMGAGESNIDLRNSQLQKLKVEAGAVALYIKLSKSAIREAEINAGVGELNLDLTGPWNHSLTLDVAGGIGDIKLILPKNTGVRVKASGLGSKSMGGLSHQQGNYYTNAAYGKSAHTLTINVTGGLGSITVSNE